MARRHMGFIMTSLTHQRISTALLSCLPWMMPTEVCAQPSPPSGADIEAAYRAHMDAVNAETSKVMGKHEAGPYLVTLLSVQAGSCDFHSGVSYSCRVVVSAQSGGRVSRNRMGEVLMTRTADGWRFRMQRRPR